MKKLVIIILLIFVPITSIALDLNKSSKVTILVVGEDDEPINGANVSVSFETKEPSKVSTIKGSTDKEGRFSATSSAFLGKIYFGALSEGYYKSVGEYQFKDSGIGHWKPWNPELRVVLRKIGNPVPMYAREAIKIIPVIGEDVGFDLMKFDWIVPYGQGTHSDFIFNLEKKVVDRNNFDATLTLTFQNRFDGIQLIKEGRRYGSELKLRRSAPQDGYNNKIVLFKKRNMKDGVQINYTDEDNYIFRVRCEEKYGKLFKAMYGKIIGPISFGDVSRKDTATVQFKYYLNPDNTNNLEFDPKHNLFGPLQPLEQVNEP